MNAIRKKRRHHERAPIELPFSATRIRLHYFNRQSIEHAKGSCYDGGVLEISTDGGAPWSQVTDDKLLSDPYDGTVLFYAGNLLAGRLAWCSRDYQWLDSTVDLDAYAGETVTLRFRLGTDSSVGSIWYIDKLWVEACQDPRARPVYLPVVFR